MSIFKSKKLKRISAVLLGVCVAVAGVVIGVGYSQGWFNSNEESIADNGSGFTISDTVNKGISLSSVAVQGTGTYNEKTYESSATISATVTPSDATDLTLTWSLAWAEECDDTLSDYVELSATTSSSSNSITVYCYQPFGTQIILTAKANGGLSTEVTGSAYLDYYKSFDYYEGIYNTTSNVIISSDNVENLFYSYFDINTEVLYGYSHFASYSSVGTLSESFESFSITIEISGAFANYLKSSKDSSCVLLYNLALASDAPAYTINVDGLSSDVISWDEILETFFGMSAGEASNVYSSDIYNCYNSYYDSTSLSAFDVQVKVVGASSGKISKINFFNGLYLDPSGYYTEATAVTLGETNIYF